MKVKMKMFAFRLTDYTIEQLDAIKVELQRQNDLTGWKRKIGRTDVIRVLVEREWDNLNSLTREAFEKELEGKKPRSRSRSKPRKEKSDE